MTKKILSLDLGITSIGYSILEELENNRYSLIDYGVSMFDKATDKDGKSKKLLHSASSSASKLVNLRKKRKKNLAKLFEEFGFGEKNYFLYQEKQNFYKNKWELRAKKAFEEKLNIEELFSILYAIAKYRGYKSLDTSDLLEELCVELDISFEEEKAKKDDEKGKIKLALKTIENLKLKYPNKTVATIIYEEEMKKKTPTFRNHDNYRYMIRREDINDEIKKIIFSQVKFGLFEKDFKVNEFTSQVIKTIDDQKESSNNEDLFARCKFYKEHKVSHQYSLLADIFKMYQAVSNITFNKEKTKITKEQIKLIHDDFFAKIKKGKNITDIKYKDIRKILKLDDNVKIFNKEDGTLSIVKFHFLSHLSKFGDVFNAILEKPNRYEILKEIFDVLGFEKSPKTIYEKLKDKVDDKTIIELIKHKTGSSLRTSSYAMVKFIPFFEQGYTLSDIKKELNISEEENYTHFKKGIKYLSLSQFEKDDNLSINNHPVKYVVSAVLRLVKHLHVKHGVFDEIRVESTRELSLSEEAKKEIEKANKALEKQIDDIVSNKEYQAIAEYYGKNLRKYARKILMYEEQNRRDIYTGEGIEFKDIFTSKVDIDHIIPQSLGGLSVKHNLVLVHRDSNLKKSNQLPMNFINDKEDFKNRVEDLFKERKINWKKKINLLATTLEETFKDTFESKELRATSYIEALSAQVLKRYYPFPNQTKNSMEIRHIQGRATSNIRKLLHVKTKTRDTNIHHAIDAILIGLTNKSWLQKLSSTFRENLGKIDDEARANIKKAMPLIEGIEPKELVEMIEERYNEFGEESIFYKDIFGNTKTVNFWVSKKPMVSKVHKDTIYSKKPNDIYTVRENITAKFIALKITPVTKAEVFVESFKKEILTKMYLYKTNPNDVICKIVQKRADEIVKLLNEFVWLDAKDKEAMSEAKIKLDDLVHSPLIDNNGNEIRKVKFYQTNLTGFEIRGGLATKEKTFIGFKSVLENDTLQYERIDVSNTIVVNGIYKLKENDDSFKVYKNDLVFFIYPDGGVKGGKIVSFLEDKKMAAFSNPRFPASISNQPHIFLTIFNGKANSHKQHSVGKATGIIKLNLDILGNIKSYITIGDVQSELLEFIKNIKS
ncbi:MAG TPA: type II CRISPR RNA-guided endonuclease Cas9 [Sulfurospirillum sp. UBA11407]|nr:MAG TPA: type II CRISPR RNA-guided endonuclease Cas9 [Sulfurospirillum sp. UBA11407]DAB34530.1 MAG TPA: type II CRISPR RNA-guided endonuclease Cas9 [Sulfurospirillum sp. UBA12182]